MADKSDKQFDPTPYRISKAREDGNVFKSQEVVSVLMLTFGLSVMYMGATGTFDALKRLTADIFSQAATIDMTPEVATLMSMDLMQKTARILTPLLGVLMACGITFNLMQSGINITTKPLAPKIENLSPLKGLKRIFSIKGLVSTGKALLKIAIVGPIAFLHINGLMPELMQLHTLPMMDTLQMLAMWMFALVLKILVVLIFLAAVDFVYEKWQYKEDMKMSKQEIDDEQKMMQGDPQVKSKMREKAREILRRPRLDHAVLKADVVVTNPTHYAVALRYDPNEAPAPTVLVKGIRKRALRIKHLAKENNIPTVENRPLARALYAAVEEGMEIPEDLYAAVATLLAEIYRQQNRRPAA